MKLLDAFRWLNKPEQVKDPLTREALVRGPIAVAADGSLDKELSMGDIRRYLNGLKDQYRVSPMGFPFVATMDDEPGNPVSYLCIPIAIEPYKQDFRDSDAKMES